MTDVFRIYRVIATASMSATIPSTRSKRDSEGRGGESEIFGRKEQRQFCPQEETPDTRVSWDMLMGSLGKKSASTKEKAVAKAPAKGLAFQMNARPMPASIAIGANAISRKRSSSSVPKMT